MFTGYLDRSLDRDAFVDDGWFRTGDLAVYDGEYLTIVDRLKDVIIRGGENISALEVESLLVTHTDVADAACVAMPDPVMGEGCAQPWSRATARHQPSKMCARSLVAHGLAHLLPNDRTSRRPAPNGERQGAEVSVASRGPAWMTSGRGSAVSSARLQLRDGGTHVSVLGQTIAASC